MTRRIIYWFRSDLRLQDNEGFHTATKMAQEVIPVYVFDPRQFERTRFGFRRAGAQRAQFLLASVIELRNALRSKGGDLLIRVGEPEKVIAKLAEDFGARYVYTSKEIAPDETQVETSLSKKLKVINIDIRLFWMNTLSNTSDLPYSISKLPGSFQDFYSGVKGLHVKPGLPEPEHIQIPADYEAGAIPGLPMLGIDPQEILSGNADGPGGELEAKLQLKKYVDLYITGTEQTDSCDHLTDLQISKWLTVGCLSSRSIYNAVTPNGQINPNAVIIIKNLLKRDYANWTLLRYGSRLFKPSGIIHDMEKRWSNDHSLFKSWRNGETTDPKVNTVMKKLNDMGYLTLAERLAAADFLSNTMHVNWTWGAMYFESLMIDYNVANSWGNWNLVAGVSSESLQNLSLCVHDPVS